MLWNIYNVYCPSHYITILESAKRIYRSYRSHCTEFQRIPSVSEVHVFRWAAQSFVLLGYEKSYLNRRVNGVFMPPNNHAIDATFEHMIPHFSLCSIYRSKCIPRPCVCTNPSIFAQKIQPQTGGWIFESFHSQDKYRYFKISFWKSIRTTIKTSATNIPITNFFIEKVAILSGEFL